MPQFFFVETGEWYVDPQVVERPEPANAEPEAFEEPQRPQPLRFQKRLEVRDQHGRTRACATLRSPTSNLIR